MYAFVFIRLMPQIDAVDSSEVAWVEMIDERGFAFGFGIRAVVAAI